MNKRHENRANVDELTCRCGGSWSYSESRPITVDHINCSYEVRHDQSVRKINRTCEICGKHEAAQMSDYASERSESPDLYEICVEKGREYIVIEPGIEVRLELDTPGAIYPNTLSLCAEEGDGPSGRTVCITIPQKEVGIVSMGRDAVRIGVIYI